MIEKEKHKVLLFMGCKFYDQSSRHVMRERCMIVGSNIFSKRITPATMCSTVRDRAEH